MAELCPHCDQPLKSADSERCEHCHVRLARYKNTPRAQITGLTQQIEFSSFLKQDKGLWTLLAVNLFTILLAVYESWELQFAMTVYGAQSVLIGIGVILRMLNLQQFSTSGFKINNKPAKEEPATKGKVALFFMIHYGMFHGFYAVFLGLQYDLSALPWLPITLCILAFAIQQFISVKDDICEDQDRKPNIGTLMFLPYARILPMHLMIIIGSWFAGSVFGLLLFLLLKTAADILMYIVELHTLTKKERKLP